MFDDPEALTRADWNDIHIWLTLLWTYFPILITFALTMLVAHAVIPSLINTRHLSPAAARLRLPLTLFGFGFLTAAVILMVFVIRRTLEVEDFYDRWLF